MGAGKRKPVRLAGYRTDDVTDSTERVYVLGCGLAGLSVAAWLQSFGVEVTLVDRAEPGSGASYGNAGLFANYAVLPNASRSTLRGLPRLLTGRDRALSVRSRYLGAMLGYGRRFFEQSRPDAFSANRDRLATLLREADPVFSETLALAGAGDLMRRHGCLWIYRTEKAWQAARAHDGPMRAVHGVTYEELDPNAVTDFEPALRDAGIVGGLYFPETQHLVSPGGVSRRLFDTVIERGGTFLQDEVIDIQISASGRPRLVTPDNVHEADQVVVALGAHSADLFRRMGYRMPLVSERGYHVSLSPESAQLTRPVGWLEHFFYATPMCGGVRLAGTTEFASPAAVPDRKRWIQLERWAKTLFGPGATVTSTWCGSRASTPDGLPIVGPLARHPRVHACTGHGHLGVTLAGLTGKRLAERIAGGADGTGWSHLEPARFIRQAK